MPISAQHVPALSMKWPIQMTAPTPKRDLPLQLLDILPLWTLFVSTPVCSARSELLQLASNAIALVTVILHD